MAAGIGNPLGAIQLFDAGAPSVITAYPEAIISGGCFVYTSGAAGVIGSGADSFVSTDLKAIGNASGTDFNGIALYTAGSNQPLAVATKGFFIVQAGNAVVGGRYVASNGNAVVNCETATLFASGVSIGRALVGAGSEGFTIVEIK